MDDAGSGGDVQREDGIARHTPEPNAALLPAGEERATRCKDKWEPQAPRATGVLAAARLLRVDAPHKTTIPFSWQCPLQRARRGEESTRGAVAGAALGRVHAPSHAPCKFLLMPKVSLCTQNPPKAAQQRRQELPAQPALKQPLRCTEEASSISTQIFSSIGCSLGLPKAKTRMETSHFFGKNSTQSWFFSLVLVFSFFFSLVFG